jgi:hypothetical protein
MEGVEVTFKEQQVGCEIYVCDTCVLDVWMKRLPAISPVPSSFYTRRRCMVSICERQYFMILDELVLPAALTPTIRAPMKYFHTKVDGHHGPFHNSHSISVSFSVTPHGFHPIVSSRFATTAQTNLALRG